MGGIVDAVKKVLAPSYEGTFSEAFSQARKEGKDFFKWNGNRYSSKLDTEVFRESNGPNYEEGYAQKDAARRIIQVENSQKKESGGYDKKTDRWYPHKSAEGGAKTIAYGIKLNQDNNWVKLVKKQGYLTGEQAEEAVYDMTPEYMEQAGKIYNNRFGKGAWESLSEKSKSMLTDYQYNAGLQHFPKLMEGFNEGDIDKIEDEYKRYVTWKKKGRTYRRELGRNKELKADIDSIRLGFYPIKK